MSGKSEGGELLKYILGAIGVVVLFFLLLFALRMAHRTPILSGLDKGLFCSPGPLITVDCRPGSPCRWIGDGGLYTAGHMCHPNIEGELCSDGIIWDCYWRTVQADEYGKGLRCKCWP